VTRVASNSRLQKSSTTREQEKARKRKGFPGEEQEEDGGEVGKEGEAEAKAVKDSNQR
jgi:hypothetical protein